MGLYPHREGIHHSRLSPRNSALARARACAYACNRILMESHYSEISRGIRRVATTSSRCYDKPSLMKQPRQCAPRISLSLSLSLFHRRWRNVSPRRIITQWPRRGAFIPHNRVSAIGRSDDDRPAVLPRLIASRLSRSKDTLRPFPPSFSPC